MSQPAADRNLLFGILAMQMDFISRDQLLAAMQGWVFDKSKSLGEVLQAQGALKPDNRQALDALVEQHLQKHGNDMAQSLTAIGGAEICNHLQGIADADVQASLAHVAAPQSATEADPYATIMPGLPAGSPKQGAPTLSGAPTHPSPGSLRFRLVRPHAKGGLGEVFVALDEELHREVALKEIQDRQADNPESRTRFMLEAEITGGLEHPGIVPVYGLGSYPDGRPYYAMRFIRGDSLKDAIDRFHGSSAGMSPGDRALELRGLLGRFVDVCNAIAYAHSRDILHRDLKPANIMLGKFGETLVVDWGLAKPLDHPEKVTGSASPGEGSLMPMSMHSASKTLFGAAVGTPQYMSPEQAAGKLDQLGPSSDIYSLGATLYCILTGQSPATDSDIGVVLQRVQAGDFPKPRAVKPDIDPALEAVCLKAMAFKPIDRYASARMFADDIEHWLADEPVSAWEEPWTIKARRWVKRHTTLVASVGSAVSIALVGMVIATILLTAANERERQAKLKAEENFQLARSAVDRYMTAVANERLLNEKGMEDLKRNLLEGAREFSEKFLQARAGDKELQGELAKANYHLAQINGEIGQRKKAIELHQEAARLFETLPPDKTGPDFSKDQATCYHHLGRLFREEDQLTKSETFYGKALDLWNKLFQDRPKDEQVHVGRARTLMGVGNLQQVVRKLDKAEDSYKQSLAGWQALADAHPKRLEFQRELGVNQNNLGMVYIDMAGKQKEAESALRTAQKIQKKLTDERPIASQYQNDLARSSFMLAEFLYGTVGPKSEAPSLFEQAADRWQMLVERHPAVVGFQVRLAETRLWLSRVYRQAGNNKKAVLVAEKALVVQRELADRYKETASYQADLAYGLFYAGDAYRSGNDLAKAGTVYTEAVGIQEKLSSETKSAVYRSDLARTYDRLGLLHRKAKRPKDADRAFKKSVEVWEKLTGDYPKELLYARDLAFVFLNLGDLHADGGDLKEAAVWYSHAVDSLTALNQPKDPRIRDVLREATQLRDETLKAMKKS